MLHTIPNQAARTPKDSEIRFMETSARVPPPIKTWWYAGKSIGYEFIYPRKQALELAKSTSEPILTTAQETTDFEKADLARVDESNQQAAVRVEENPAPAEASGRAQSADTGASSTSATAQDVRADERARSTARTELPRTASSVPTVFLLGMLALTLGFGLSLVPRTRA
jgi:cobalamin biosynthesis Mg chelatase CobN